jgi:hypothetical protein
MIGMACLGATVGSGGRDMHDEITSALGENRHGPTDLCNIRRGRR